MSDVLSRPPGEITLRRLLAPLAPFLADPKTREVVINKPGEFAVEKNGGWTRLEAPALDYAALDAIARLGGRMTSQDFWSQNASGSTRLPDRERMTVAMPPITQPGIINLTIRRPNAEQPTLEWLRDGGWFSFLPPGRDWMAWLRDAVRAKMNIGFTGTTGSSKTTAMNACANEIGEDERIATLESTPELFLARWNWIDRLYAQTPGRGLRSASETLEMALRERPDRLLFGEVRTGEAWALLQAMMSGLKGTMLTTHANPGVEPFVERMHLMIRQNEHSKGVPEETIKRLVREQFDVVIHCQKVDGHDIPYRATRVDEIAHG